MSKTQKEKEEKRKYEKKNQSNLWIEIKKNKYIYLYISPFFIIFGIFWLYPYFYSFVLSLYKWHGMGRWKWLGFDNYSTLLKDQIFLKALWNSCWYWVGIVPIRTIVALFLAILFNEILISDKIKGVLRASCLVPYVISTVVVAIIFMVLYSYPSGFINTVLNQVCIPPIPWLKSTMWSKPSVILMSIWQDAGYFSLIFFAGLQSIPKQLYEAASLDGANRYRNLVSISIPLLKPYILFVFIISTIRVINMFEGPFVLTEGGPLWSSTTPTIYLYDTAFAYLKLGYGACVAVVITIILSGAALVQFKTLGKKE